MLAVTLAIVWLVAIATDNAMATGLVTLVAMSTPVLLAPRLRPGALVVGCVCVAASIAAVLLSVAAYPRGAGTLAAMIVSAVAAAVILPVVYAVTFDDGPPTKP